MLSGYPSLQTPTDAHTPEGARAGRPVRRAVEPGGAAVVCWVLCRLGERGRRGMFPLTLPILFGVVNVCFLT